MSKNHYQQEMSGDTADLDNLGDAAVAEMDFEDSMAGTQRVREPMADGKSTMVRDVAKFGMLPSQEVDKAYAADRAETFRKMSESTSRGVGPTGTKGKDSAAFSSQQAQMKGYNDDVLKIPDAERDYGMLVPLANMAARSFVKANAVAEWGGFDENTDIAGSLSKKEAAGLDKGIGKDFTQSASVAIAGGKMMTARKGIVGASHQLALALDHIAIKKLNTEKADTEAEKQKIHDKIAKVTKIVGYAETAGTMIAGGGGFLNEHLPGAPEPVMTDDLQQDTGKNMEKVGGAIETGAGYVSKAVEFGMELYYHGALEKLDAHIASLNATIGVTESDAEFREITAARALFEKAQSEYKDVVDQYAAAIADRHKLMAAAGKTADKSADPKGGNDSKVGDKMEFATVMLELQSFLTVALDAGKAAAETTKNSESSMRTHRNKPWGYLSDSAGGNNTPNHEPKGPDLEVVAQMASLSKNWMTAAAEIKATVDTSVSTGIKPALDKAGYDDKY